MNNSLINHLTESGAAGDEGSPDFPANGASLADILVAMPDQIVLRVSGADASDFLQGQFSNDVAALADPGTQMTTWSNPKGRVLALFPLTRHGDEFFIRLPADLAAGFIKRLRMYVLRAAVVVEPLDDFGCIAVAGEAGAQALGSLAGTLPAQAGEVGVYGQVLISRVRGADARFEMIGPGEEMVALWKQLAVVSTPSARDDWHLQDIDAGVPSIVAATSEAFVLQMLNLQLIDGVSFKKGCFPGQEVVARMQYLGKLKRRMYRASLNCDTVPVAGTDIHRAEGGSAVGKVVSAAFASEGVCHLLAVLAIDASTQPLHCEGHEAAIELLDLPYEIEVA